MYYINSHLLETTFKSKIW